MEADGIDDAGSQTFHIRTAELHDVDLVEAGTGAGKLGEDLLLLGGERDLR
jgi:hypothetical protein